MPPHAPVELGPIKAYGPPCAFEPNYATLLLGEAPNRWMQANLEERGHHVLFREDLAELCDVTMLDYYRCFARANLLARNPGRSGGGDAWPAAEARAQAERVREHLERFRRVVFVGRRVAGAFREEARTWFTWFPYQPRPLGPQVRAVVVPHPSKASRWWNDEGNVAKARTFWSGLAQELGAAIDVERAARRARSCPACHGAGSMTDLADSGSGAQVYCDCAAGAALRAADAKERA